MKKANIFLAFALGCLSPLTVGRVAVRLGAQGRDEGGNIHVCVGEDGVLRRAGLTTPCPVGQRSLLLERAGTADAGKPDEEQGGDSAQIDKAILDDLSRRLDKLESQDCASPGKSRVVEPFEVFGRDGKRVFTVVKDGAGLFNSSDRAVIRMASNKEGGLFVADGVGNKAFFGVS